MRSQPHAAESRAHKSKRGRKRAAATTLTADEVENAKKRIRSTTKASLQSNTRNVYKSYMRGIDEWYFKNHPEYCTADGVVDEEK